MRCTAISPKIRWNQRPHRSSRPTDRTRPAHRSPRRRSLPQRPPRPAATSTRPTAPRRLFPTDRERRTRIADPVGHEPVHPPLGGADVIHQISERPRRAGWNRGPRVGTIGPSGHLARLSHGRVEQLRVHVFPCPCPGFRARTHQTKTTLQSQTRRGRDTPGEPIQEVFVTYAASEQPRTYSAHSARRTVGYFVRPARGSACGICQEPSTLALGEHLRQADWYARGTMAQCVLWTA